MTHILSGTELSNTIKAGLKEKVSAFPSKGKRPPGLATVLVGDDPASAVYVKNKIKACEFIGIRSFHIPLSASVSQEVLMGHLRDLNAREEIDGILVQLPLPKGFASDEILDLIRPDKDADGFHPVNVGNLLLGRPGILPCTPFGIMKLLESTGEEWAGKHAVVVGRSNIVGKPMSLLLLQKHMTVTICHSRTRHLPDVIRSADVVIAALGKPEFIRGDAIREGAIVIDVGINRLTDGRLVGDVHFESAKEKASHITPVPGGVGPMTIAMLMWNTLEAYEKRIER